MRSFITALAIGAILVTGSILYNKSIEKISDELIRCNNNILQLVYVDNFADADELINILNNYIDEKRVLLDATGSHEEIDKIETCITELKEYNAHLCKADAIARIKTLDVLFTRMPKNYRLRPENIL